MSLFKGKIDVGKTVDNLLNKVDDSNFTIEEKNKLEFKRAEQLVEFYKQTLDENTERSITRRFIAKFLIIYYVLIVTLCIVLKLIKIDISSILTLVETFKLSTSFIMILAFFFGGYYVNNYVFKNKKLNNDN